MASIITATCAACNGPVKGRLSPKMSDVLVGVRNLDRITGYMYNGLWYHARKECRDKGRFTLPKVYYIDLDLVEVQLPVGIFAQHLGFQDAYRVRCSDLSTLKKFVEEYYADQPEMLAAVEIKEEPHAKS